MFEHDLRANASGVCREGKPVPTFPDHALAHDPSQCKRFGDGFRRYCHISARSRDAVGERATAGCAARKAVRAKTAIFQISGGSFERQPGESVFTDMPMGMLGRRGPGVRASGTAGLGAGAERLIDDGLDGARATAALGTATETAIDLLGIARQVFRSTDGITHVVVGDDVAGTDNHGNAKVLR